MTDTETVRADPVTADPPRKATKAHVAAIVASTSYVLTGMAARAVGLGEVADDGQVAAAGFEVITMLQALVDDLVAGAVAAVATWWSVFWARNGLKLPGRGATLQVHVWPAVAILLLSACADRPGGESTGILDRIATDRCDEAKLTITRLRDTADLYQADDLTARLARAARIAEIWCPGFVAEPPRAVPEVEAVPEGGSAP